MKTYMTFEKTNKDEDPLPNGVSFITNIDNVPVFSFSSPVLQDGFRVLTASETEMLEKFLLENKKEKMIGLTRWKIQREAGDIPSLLGKTANFTVALARIQLNIMSKLATAQSLADVRASVAEYAPLMQQLQAKIESGEILSVQSAQNMDDEAAIFEGLEAMTAVARIFQQQE